MGFSETWALVHIMYFVYIHTSGYPLPSPKIFLRCSGLYHNQ